MKPPTDRIKEKSRWMMVSYLGVVHHMNSLVDDAFSVFAQKLEDVLHLGLVRQSAQADTILARAGRDHLLRQERHLRQLRNQRRLSLVRARIHRPIQHLIMNKANCVK